ncbi:MAG: HIT family protein [Bacilli bacterium]|nr:HIT family protein [Bacilli bacterium]
MCVFCKIIDGTIPCYKVYEDEDFIAFLDISQATVGHTLLVPKMHAENVFCLPSHLQEKMGVTLVKMANQLKKTLHVSNLNILNNNGEAAGQTVPHFHIHLIPRYPDDDLTIRFKPHLTTPESSIELQKKILSN